MHLVHSLSKILIILLFATTLMSGCGEAGSVSNPITGGPSDPQQPSPEQPGSPESPESPAECLTCLKDSFENGLSGWVGGFADYPAGEEVFYELSFGHDGLPPITGKHQKRFRITGNNHSDDLFMFLKKKISFLKPNTPYSVKFRVALFSQYPEASFGVGGSPGAGVHLKAGATAIEPVAIEDPVDQHLRMNIDKGQQAMPGPDAIVLGSIGIPGEKFVYTLIERNNSNEPFAVTSDENGALWLIVGTESAFESTTTLYYDRIEVEFVEVEIE